MKKILALTLILTLLLTGCQTGKQAQTPASDDAAPADEPSVPAAEAPAPDCTIVLDDTATTVDGQPIGTDTAQAVYAANDIVYYPTGQDFTFGEGTEADTHEAAEADAHTVIHITQPGVYAVSGRLTAGQIAVDLGEDAEDDPNAVVTLLLNGADITCTVAPAVIFYSVYECGNADSPTETVDTSAAGANVFLADGSENNISGSYVAKIYKPDSVELNEAGNEVADAKKLHKYDAAFYSKMSMNIDGNDGILNISAENEGLDSELHLTVNGGDIRIESGNDGINTNEDGVSVTTVNGGSIEILVNGATGEGDGIDSNGWIVINGGSVKASACGFSADAGIDSDMGIYLNGGSVQASGYMLDEIAGGTMNYAVFSFASAQPGGSTYVLKDADGNAVTEAAPKNGFSILLLADETLTPGDYTFYRDEAALQSSSGFGAGGMQRPGGMQPQGGEMPEMPEGMTPPEGTAPEMPEGMTPPEGTASEMPEGMTPPVGAMPEMPQGEKFPGGSDPSGEASGVFSIREGGSYFSGITEA